MNKGKKRDKPRDRLLNIENKGQDGRRVGVLNSLLPQIYLDNFQIILNTYEFDLRFKERTAGMLQREEFPLLTSTTCF